MARIGLGGTREQEVEARISGEMVWVGSGQIIVISGYVTVSGSPVKVSGQIVEAGVSGTVVVTSGVVELVSSTVIITSGAVSISGNVVEAGVSGTVVVTSGVVELVSSTVIVTSGMVGLVSATVIVTSGAVSISGNVVEAGVSGTVVVTSGVVELVSSTVIITSGVVVAKISGEVVNISGEIVSPIVPTMVKTGIAHMVALSGEVLHSGATKAVLVKALSTNSGYIIVGGSGDKPFWGGQATSAQGMLLSPGEAQSKDISDFQWIWVASQNSGNIVCFDGVY